MKLSRRGGPDKTATKNFGAPFKRIADELEWGFRVSTCDTGGPIRLPLSGWVLTVQFLSQHRRIFESPDQRGYWRVLGQVQKTFKRILIAHNNLGLHYDTDSVSSNSLGRSLYS